MLVRFPAAFYISSVGDENVVLGFRQVQVGQHMIFRQARLHDLFFHFTLYTPKVTCTEPY